MFATEIFFHILLFSDIECNFMHCYSHLRKVKKRNDCNASDSSRGIDTYNVYLGRLVTKRSSDMKDQLRLGSDCASAQSNRSLC